MPVHLQQSARDLQEISRAIVANPTVFKAARRSGPMSGIRRSIQSRGAAASGAATLGKKLVSTAISFVPVPKLAPILDAAWTKMAEYLKQRQINSHIEAPANLEEKVKFELKVIGGMVADWDGYRWKVQHAAEQFQAAATEATATMTTAPCDTWVRVWAKYFYLGSRIQKLRQSIAAVRAVTDEVEVWLMKVEDDYADTYNKAKQQYDTDVRQLKTMQVHDSCSETKCMFKAKDYAKQVTVPTSDPAKFFMKTTSALVGNLNDRYSQAVDKAAGMIPT